jgi:hypothetical protein
MEAAQRSRLGRGQDCLYDSSSKPLDVEKTASKEHNPSACFRLYSEHAVWDCLPALLYKKIARSQEVSLKPVIDTATPYVDNP